MTRRLLIAGTFASRRAADRVYGRLADKLDAEVVPLPNLGLGHSLDAAEEIFERWHTDEPVDLVGHSQGGLVAALLGTFHSDWVRSVATLGAPLRGARLTSFLTPIPAVRCMTPGARVLEALVGDKTMLCIAGAYDPLVPPTSAILPGAQHVTFPVGHMRLITHSGVTDALGDWLQMNDADFRPGEMVA